MGNEKKKNVEPQRHSWGTWKKKRNNGEPQKYSWERRRRRRVNPRDIGGEREEEEW